MANPRTWCIEADYDGQDGQDDLYYGTALRYDPKQGPLNVQASRVMVVEKSAYDEAIKALRTLRNEVRGTLSAHRYAIEYDHGNSNWRCLEIALERAEAQLSHAIAVRKEEAE